MKNQTNEFIDSVASVVNKIMITKLGSQEYINIGATINISKAIAETFVSSILKSDETEQFYYKYLGKQ